MFVATSSDCLEAAKCRQPIEIRAPPQAEVVRARNKVSVENAPRRLVKIW